MLSHLSPQLLSWILVRVIVIAMGYYLFKRNVVIAPTTTTIELKFGRVLIYYRRTSVSKTLKVHISSA